VFGYLPAAVSSAMKYVEDRSKRMRSDGGSDQSDREATSRMKIKAMLGMNASVGTNGRVVIDAEDGLFLLIWSRSSSEG